MRIRSTKPEFWRSKRIASVDWDARLVLKALESYVDDNGVGKYDLELIVGDTFSRDVIRDPSGTLMRVQACVGTLLQAGLLWKYEDDDQELIYISFWESTQYIQRPAKGRFRRPDGTLAYNESKIGAPNHEPSGALMSPPSLIRGTGEQGNREQDSCASAGAERDSDLAGDFEQWWETYPRKRGKGQALKAYRTARKTATAEDLIDAVASQRATLTAKGPDFVPYPATWLNGQRWLDEIETGTPADEHPYAHLPAPKNWDAIRAEAQASRGGAS